MAKRQQKWIQAKGRIVSLNKVRYIDMNYGTNGKPSSFTVFYRGDKDEPVMVFPDVGQDIQELFDKVYEIL